MRFPSLFVALCVLLNTGLVGAEDASMTSWMKYLEGNWEYEVSDGTQGNVAWTFEADEQSMIGRIKEGDVTGIELGGWQPGPETGMINGYNSKGNYWQIEYKQFSATGNRGTIHGKTDESEFSGDFRTTIENENRWKWTIQAKTPAGEELTVSATYDRVKPQPPPTKADRLQAFEYFIGKWKSVHSDGEVAEWTFDWGHNKNSIENTLIIKNAAGEVKLANSGFMVWDGGNRRFVNACVSASGNRVEFLWRRNEQKEWQTWLRGSQSTTTVTIIDENSFTMAWGDQSRTFRRQD